MKTKLMMAVVAAAMAFAAQAATATVDGVKYTYEIGGLGAIITKVEGSAKTIVIPEKLGGNKVISIDGSYSPNRTGAFENNVSVMKVVIPEAVVNISYAAFKGCTALTSVNIPSGVTVIDQQTFYGCTNLRSVTLPSGLKRIASYAFYQCSSLSAIEIPEGVTSIETEAFMYCAGLREVIVPDTVTSMGAFVFADCSNLERVKFSSGMKTVPQGTFRFCYQLAQISIPEGVISVEDNAFHSCSALKELIVPASVNSVRENSFYNVGCVIFQGKPPAGLAFAGFLTAVYPKEFGSLWRAQLEIANICGYVNPNKPVVTVVSSKVRENNPTVLDVVYKVTSTKPTVKVRALAFEDGERTLNKVTRPETFIDGTAANLGDAIAPNVEHKLSWQVSSDFKTDLAKMKFEVLAVEDGILPLEFITVPANGANKKMQLSWNLLTEAQVFDALLWLYADKDAGLTLANGVLKNGSTQLANESALYGTGNWTYVNGVPVYSSYPAIPYVISKMGFSVLSGDKLTYANEMTRLGLSPGGFRQYAWREFDD